MARRLPSMLFRGRVRTSTLLLVVAFVGVLALYVVVRPEPTPSYPPGAGYIPAPVTTSRPAPAQTSSIVPSTSLPPSATTTQSLEPTRPTSVTPTSRFGAPPPSAAVPTTTTTPVPSAGSTSAGAP